MRAKRPDIMAGPGWCEFPVPTPSGPMSRFLWVAGNTQSFTVPPSFPFPSVVIPAPKDLCGAPEADRADRAQAWLVQAELVSVAQG